MLDLLCCQSPALALLSLVLLLRFFLTRKKHPRLAAVRLVCCVFSLLLAIACYFIGMFRGVFTIRDFYRVRLSGWIGLATVALICVLLAFHRIKTRSAQRKLEKTAQAAAAEQHSALEQAVEQTMRQTRDAVQQEELRKRLKVAEQAAQKEADLKLGKEEPIQLTLDP